MASKKKARATPAHISPMAATAVKQLPDGPEWLYEVSGTDTADWL